MAASARRIIDEQSQVLEIWDRLAKPGLHRGKQIVAQCLEANGNMIGEPSAVLFRRRNSARGFDEKYRQIVDLEMWFHLLEQGDLVYTQEPLCSFRRHPLQLTAFNQANQIGRNEATMLLLDYCWRPWVRDRLSRQALFVQLYRGRKRGPGPEGAQEVEKELLRCWGGGGTPPSGSTGKSPNRSLTRANRSRSMPREDSCADAIGGLAPS